MTTATRTATKADRFHRAPKGGAFSPVNFRFYKGGQFMPMESSIEIEPAKLEEASRQISWAERIRREELGRIQREIRGLWEVIGQGEALMVAWRQHELREGTDRLERLRRETSASWWIEQRRPA